MKQDLRDTAKQDKENLLKLEQIQREFIKTYHSQVIYSVFTLLFVTNIMINVDHGSLPGCFNAIKEKLDVGNLGFGILGSIVFVGLIFGSIAASGLFSQGDWIKPTLILALTLNAISLYAFTLSNSFYLMVFVRGAIGFFQVFVCIYMPVWVDTYGSES
jgi:sugar phosphate permease